MLPWCSLPRSESATCESNNYINLTISNLFNIVSKDCSSNIETVNKTKQKAINDDRSRRAYKLEAVSRGDGDGDEETEMT